MYPQKGEIAAGSDADLVIWDPEAAYTISAATHHMRVDYSMFEGFRVKGNAHTVLSRGEADRPRRPVPRTRRTRAIPQARRSWRRVEVRSIRSSPLYNEDLAPIPVRAAHVGHLLLRRTVDFDGVCIPTYMLASGLIAGGMNWWQAMLTIALGNLIVLIPMVLNAHAGTKYGIPFPVFVRASFGVLGANIPAVLRALVACGWFGIQTWIGGQAIYSMLKILWPASASMPVVGWICFFVFWVMNM